MLGLPKAAPPPGPASSSPVGALGAVRAGPAPGLTGSRLCPGDPLPQLALCPLFPCTQKPPSLPPPGMLTPFAFLGGMISSVWGYVPVLDPTPVEGKLNTGLLPPCPVLFLPTRSGYSLNYIVGPLNTSLTKTIVLSHRVIQRWLL